MVFRIERQPVFAVVAAVWAATNVVLSASEIINRRRDLVLTGKLDGTNLTREHREMIPWHDWMPLTAATGLTCLIFAGLLLVAPSLLGFRRSNAAWICYGLSSIPAIGAFSLMAGAVCEFQLMTEVITKSP